MKNIIPFVLLSFSFLHITAATIARYSGSRIFWDARTPITIFNGGGYSRLIELSDGRLMACCESGGIKISFSTNQGRSWSSPTLIAPNNNNTPNCVPDLIQLSNGTIIVAYNPRPSTPYTEDRRFGIRLRRSTNNGKSWSEEIFVYDADYTFENGCWEPSLLELPSGELHLYFADESPYTNSGEQQISLCRSFDGGLTWSDPQRISYRSGYRDGMPVPVLLNDKRTIVVAIEDNGWSGMGDFVPTTVRTSLNNNWKNNFYVNATNTMRNQSINYDYCPVAKGGAPYLRVLPNGETVLSHQSTYGDGDNMKMFVYVGDKQAKNFKAMAKPFYLGTTKGSWWNSVAVIDTGVVVAVGGIDGKVAMVKGYPMNQFQAPYATPEVDGKTTSEDIYYNSLAKQIPMGNETGTYSYTDFAYDLDRLYVSFLVYRRNARSEEPFPDGVRLYIDNKNGNTDVPMQTSYRLDILPSGEFTAYRGNSSDWVATTMPSVRSASTISSATYRIEISIPWSEIGLSSIPAGQKLGINLETVTGDGTQQFVERIPDSSPLKPATWVPLYLMAPPIDDAISPVISQPNSTDATYDLLGRKVENTKEFKVSA